MKQLTLFIGLLILVLGCSPSTVQVTYFDETYTPAPKSSSSNIILRKDEFQRPYRAIAIIQVELGKRATRAQLNEALIAKARAIGADGLQQLDYDVDRDVYFDRIPVAVGRGPLKRPKVVTTRRVKVKKTAIATAVVFE
ncbi:MAG: hypothetical protein GXO91_10965 [FCB group bacterium]|nr:hypothetical protein [FCB group bacterium]